MHSLSANAPPSTACLVKNPRESVPLVEVQQKLPGPGPAGEFLQAAIPSLAVGSKQDGAFVTRELIGKLKTLSEASGLTFAEQLAALLCELYRLLAQRHDKSIAFDCYISVISEWTAEEVAAKFLEFCKDHIAFFTEEDFWMLAHCSILIAVNSAAFGEKAVYLHFHHKWIAMLEKVIQRLEEKARLALLPELACVLS